MIVIKQPVEWSHEFTCRECEAGIDDLKLKRDLQHYTEKSIPVKPY